MDDIRKRIEVLANGNSKDILDELNREIESFQEMSKQFQAFEDAFSPESRFIYKEFNLHRKSANRISTAMDTCQRKLIVLESKPGIKRICEIEEKLNDQQSIKQYGQLNRELSHLKQRHAKDLSEMVLNRQGILKERLKFIQLWKTILLSEIKILEECKNLLRRNILEEVNQSGDTSLRGVIEEKLKSLNLQITPIQDIKINASTLQVSNINILRKTLIDQLNHVVKIEKTIREKKHSVQVLTELHQRYSDELPAEARLSPQDLQMETSPAAREAGKTEDISSETQDSKRMAYWTKP